MTSLHPHVRPDAPNILGAGDVFVRAAQASLPLGVVLGPPRELDRRPAVIRPFPVRTARRTDGPAWLLAVTDVLVAGAGLVVLALLGITLPTPVAVLVPALWPVALASVRGYEGLRVPLGLRETTARVLRAGVGLALACLAVAALTAAHPRPGPVLMVAGLLTVGSLVPRAGGELLARRTHGRAQRTRVVVAGHHPREVSQVIEELRRDPERSFEVAMVCLAHAPKRAVYDVPVSIGLDRLTERVSDVGAGALIVLPCHHVDGETVRRLGWQLESSGTALYVGTPLLDVTTARTSVAHAGGLGMLHVRPPRLRGPTRIVKAVLERTFAVLMLVLLSPLLLLLVGAIRQDSHGPAIYRQTRVGRSGALFTMYKFRTMTADAEHALPDLWLHNMSDGVLFKMEQDPRVTRFGAFLRRYSLDELPQLINVVLGQMALVGPRPALPDEVARYSPDARRRLAVQPGLTGLWQVSGRSDLSWADTVRLDLRYVDNWSLGLDLLIVCRTARAVLGHRGAY